MDIGYVIAGALVGLACGLTGIGSGSLMTPLLLFFGINPATAVGTDLLYSSISKIFGMGVHQRNKNIDWKVVKYLATGSLPTAFLTLSILHFVKLDTATLNLFITKSLGIVMVAIALAILFKKKLLEFAQKHASDWMDMDEKSIRKNTIITGIVMGAVVSLTSIGGGALGAVALFMIYPLIPTTRLVGTELAHAVPLSAIAGLGHAGLGNVDFYILTSLLVGSIPAICIGSHFSNKFSDRFLRTALAIMLVLVGLKLSFF